MAWEVRLAKRAIKILEKIPAKDRGRIMAALDLMASNPFAGDIARLKGEDAAWRRRVGSYRLFFEIHEDARLVDIVDIRRRTSATY